MKKMWKELTACLLAVSMVFGNSALVVNAEEIGKEEESVPVAEQEMISEEEEILTSDNTEEIEEESEELEEQETDEQKPVNMMAEESIQQEEAPEAEQTEEENGIMPMTAGEPRQIEEDVLDKVYLNIESDCEWPDGEERSYFGQKQTLTASFGLLNEDDDEYREKIEGATIEWSTGKIWTDGVEEEVYEDADPSVISIQPNGNKCILTSNRKEGFAFVTATLKKDGVEIRSNTTRICVYETVVNYKFSLNDLYVHPGERFSTNDFTPQVKKYINGILSGTVKPIKCEFYSDEDETENYLTYDSNMTAFTVNNIPENEEIWGYPVEIDVTISEGKEIKEISGRAGITIHHFDWSDWMTTSAATVFAPAKQIRKCKVCGKSEEHTAGSKLKATVKPNVSSVTLKTKQSTKKFKVTLAAGDSVASWKSSNTKIATVSGKANGTCTIKAGKKTGTAKITIKTAAGATKTIKVKVQSKKVATSSIKQVPKKITVKKGQTYKLTPSIQPITSTDKAKYSSTNKKIATVTGKGVIKGKKAGKTKITVTAGKKKVTCTVVVKK